MMTRRQMTEDRRQIAVCRRVARPHQERGTAATKPPSSVLRPLPSERGFSLVSAIFLLVVIAALGTFAVTLSTTQHQSQALDVMGSRAYQAARAGIEWAAHKVVNEPAPALAAPCSNTSLGSLGGTLAPFTVTVNWCAASHVEGADTMGNPIYIWIYDVSAVANAGTLGGTDYVERVISVKMGK